RSPRSATNVRTTNDQPSVPLGVVAGCGVMLETLYRSSLAAHEPPQESSEESSPQPRNHYSGQALLPHRGSGHIVPSAGLCAALLGNRISAAQAGEKQHRPAHVPQTRCGIGGEDQEVAL